MKIFAAGIFTGAALVSVTFCLAARARGSGGTELTHADAEVVAGDAAAPPATRVGKAPLSKEERPLFGDDGQSDNDDV